MKIKVKNNTYPLRSEAQVALNDAGWLIVANNGEEKDFWVSPNGAVVVSGLTMKAMEPQPPPPPQPKE